MNKSLQNWLDSKVSDDTVANKYEKTPWNLPPHSASRYEDITTFQRYYKDDTDQDVKASDTIYPSLLDNMRAVNPQDIRKDSQLKLLDCITERYTHGSHTRSILIPPNSNRHHTNHLFKKLVDFSDNNDMYYVMSDGKNTEVLPFVDVDLKDAFYKFCQENTFKNK
jgi:hypothetical protein